MPTLQQLKKEFLKRIETNTDAWVDYCKSLHGLGKQAYAAACARDSNGRKHPHQWRLPNALLQAMGDVLQDNKQKLAKCRNFDEIIEFIESKRLNGIGQVAIYDTALRIGHCMGMLPDKVYLHAGTRKGADKFGIKYKNWKYILRDELPKELQDMNLHDVEDFLCIYKDGEYHYQEGCAPKTRKKKPVCP